LLTVTGGPKDVRGAADLRFLLERVVGDAGSVLLFAPPAELVAKALSEQKLDSGWLALDRSRIAIEAAADKLSPSARMDVSAHVADEMAAQGVATIAHVPKGTPRQVYVSLLASGSGEPDVLETDLDDRESMASLVKRLAETPALLRPSVGMLVVDVVDRDELRAIVLRVEPGQGAAAGGIAPGDTVVSADQKPVRGGADFNAILGGHRAGDTMQVEVRNRAGAVRGANVAVAATPALVSLNDRTVLRNKLLLDFRAMLARPDLSPLGQSVARLNIGALLITLGNHAEARRELELVALEDGPGVSGASAKFLRALCAERAGQRAEAERLWKEAAEVKGALLGEDGPLIADEVAKIRIK
jgi:hypothetical protein